MREPATVPGFESYFCRDIKLSGQLWLIETCKDNPHLRMAALLARSVVDDKDEPIRSVEEWEDWGQYHIEEAAGLYSQCSDVNSSPEDAKKK